MSIAESVAFLLGTVLPLAALAFVLAGLVGPDPDMED
jgi:hypothetical protein